MKIYRQTKKTRLGVRKKVHQRKERIYIPNKNNRNSEFIDPFEMPMPIIK